MALAAYKGLARPRRRRTNGSGQPEGGQALEAKAEPEEAQQEVLEQPRRRLQGALDQYEALEDPGGPKIGVRQRRRGQENWFRCPQNTFFT